MEHLPSTVVTWTNLRLECNYLQFSPSPPEDKSMTLRLIIVRWNTWGSNPSNAGGSEPIPLDLINPVGVACVCVPDETKTAIHAGQGGPLDRQSAFCSKNRVNGRMSSGRRTDPNRSIPIELVSLSFTLSY